MRLDPPVNKDIRWLYEDARMLVVDKPADLPVHSSGAYRFNTLDHLLRLYRPADTIHSPVVSSIMNILSPLIRTM